MPSLGLTNRRAFWAEIWDHFDFRAARRWDGAADGDVSAVVAPRDARWFVDAQHYAALGGADARPPGPVWFAGARLNHAENLLARGADGDDAIVFYSEVARDDAVQKDRAS